MAASSGRCGCGCSNADCGGHCAAVAVVACDARSL